MKYEVKFLWLSDIHYMGDGKYNGFETKAFEFIKEKIDDAYKNYDGILYLLLSGDIAFSGEENQYNQLKSKIEGCICETKRLNTRIIVCPGNHDASWTGFKSLYATSLISDSNLANGIVKIFENKYKTDSDDYNYNFSKIKFSSIFKEFSSNFSNKELTSSFTKERKATPAFKTFCNDNIFILRDENLEVSDEYYNTALEGFIVDKENKIFFIIINTAWYSIGASLEKFLNDVKDTIDFKQDEIVKIIKASHEYGRSFTGFCHPESKNLVDLIEYKIKKLLGYTKICIMHHPLEWLDWNEKESYADNTNGREITPLIKILQQCDVILSGHVHPSRVSRMEILYESKVNHLRCPLFLSHHPDKKESLFPCNGFVSMVLNRNDEEYQIRRTLNVKYHNIETGSALGVHLNVEEDSLPLELRPYDKLANQFLEVKANLDKRFFEDEYFKLFDKQLNYKSFISSVLSLESQNINSIATEQINGINIYYYEEHYFVFQDKNTWLDEINLYKIFQKAGSIKTIRLLKAGYFVSLDDVNTNYIGTEEKKATITLTKHNDKRFNQLRISFFNVLDKFIIESDTIELTDNNFLNYLKTYSNTQEAKEVFIKASATSFANHILSSDMFY